MRLFDIFKKKTAQEGNEHVEKLENFPEMLTFKLLFTDKPKLDRDKISEKVRTYISNFNGSGDGSSFIYTFPDFPIELADATIFAQCLVAVPDENKSNVELPDVAFQQNWHWAEANDIAKKCKYEVLVTDIWSRTLPYKQRVNLFTDFLVAVIKATKPDAIYSFYGQKIINPTDLISIWDSEKKQTLYGVCNVRLYNISDSANKEILMDTVGLQSIGLPDFQIRFTDLEANEVATLLWNYAYYIYDCGDVIEDGNTLEGVLVGSKWKCKRQVSSLEPNRIIINVQPN